MDTLKNYCGDENGELRTNENGEVIVPEDKHIILQEELNKLIETIVELNCNKIPIDAVNDITLTPQQSSALIDFFE